MFIKTRRGQYKIKKGDYILDNGVCLQFIAGDGRQLYFQNWCSYRSIKISKTEFNRLIKENAIAADIQKTMRYYYLRG